MAEKITELSAEDARKFFLRAECYSTIDLPKYFDFQPLLDKLAAEIGTSELNEIVLKQQESKGEQILIKDLLSDLCNQIGKSRLHNIELNTNTSETITADVFMDELIKKNDNSVYKTNDVKSKTIYPNTFDGVNYIFYQNKDSNFAWRKTELLNPALYIILVNLITKFDNWAMLIQHFKKCSNNNRLKCCSIPLATNRISEDSIFNWWDKFEQSAIELSLDYSWFAATDITDCYGSIYTHSIAWAIHGKEKCKANLKLSKKQNLLGDRIDQTIGQMTYNQTNGIPQGSVLMDFIADIVLGYADRILLWKIYRANITEFKILRYRDDYRIFAKSKENVVIILRLLSDVLADLNFRLNTQKTFISQELINDSIKPDKIYLNAAKQEETTLQKHLLLILKLAKEHSNSGSLAKALTKFMERIDPLKTKIQGENQTILVAILTDIAVHNSRVYALIATIIAKILAYETPELKETIFRKVITKLKPLPNVGHMLIWIQRMTIKLDSGLVMPELETESLCKVYKNKSNVGIWTNEGWLQDKYRNIIENTCIVSEDKIAEMPEVPDDDEVKLFINRY
ncbi:MAG: RNA-directed DNA polymerase [Bacteroidales bacterium]|nr:RNA-directed DNA polymerase [Bacteroidales bacterium]